MNILYCQLPTLLTFRYCALAYCLKYQKYGKSCWLFQQAELWLPSANSPPINPNDENMLISPFYMLTIESKLYCFSCVHHTGHSNHRLTQIIVTDCHTLPTILYDIIYHRFKFVFGKGKENYQTFILSDVKSSASSKSGLLSHTHIWNRWVRV